MAVVSVVAPQVGCAVPQISEPSATLSRPDALNTTEHKAGRTMGERCTGTGGSQGRTPQERVDRARKYLAECTLAAAGGVPRSPAFCGLREGDVRSCSSAAASEMGERVRSAGDGSHRVGQRATRQKWVDSASDVQGVLPDGDGVISARAKRVTGGVGGGRCRGWGGWGEGLSPTLHHYNPLVQPRRRAMGADWDMLPPLG